MPSQKNAVHKSNTKNMAGKYVCEVGRQEITGNLYTIWSVYRACSPLDLCYKSL